MPPSEKKKCPDRPVLRHVGPDLRFSMKRRSPSFNNDHDNLRQVCKSIQKSALIAAVLQRLGNTCYYTVYGMRRIEYSLLLLTFTKLYVSPQTASPSLPFLRITVPPNSSPPTADKLLPSLTCSDKLLSLPTR